MTETTDAKRTAEHGVRLVAEWESSPQLRAEFGEIAIYAAYRRAEDRGLIRIFGETDR